MEDVAVLGMTRADKAWLFGLLGGGGALLLGTSPWWVEWLSTVPFVPFQEALSTVASYDEPWAVLARPLGGLVLGLVGALLLVADEYRLEVARDEVVVVHDRDRRALARDQIVGVYRDSGRVVIDGRHGRVLFDKKVEAKRGAVEAAFVDHGYPWESR